MDRRVRGVLLLLCAGALWGFNGLYVQVLVQAGMGPLSIVFVRHLCALVVLGPAVSAASARARGNVLALRPEHIACCVGMGLLSNALGGVLSAYAISRVGVSTTTVLLYTAPVFGCLMSWRLYGEALTRQKLGAIACNFVGVVLVVSAGGGFAAGGSSLTGLAAGLAYGFTYSLVAVLSKPVVGNSHPLAIVCYGSLTAVVALALPALGSGELALVLRPAPALASLLYGGVSTVLAHILYQRGMAGGVETAQVAVITSVEVAVSACIGVLLLGEPCTVGKLTGLGCVLGSIAIMNTHARPGEAHGVRTVLAAEQLIGFYGAQTDLGGAVESVRRHREDAL